MTLVICKSLELPLIWMVPAIDRQSSLDKFRICNTYTHTHTKKHHRSVTLVCVCVYHKQDLWGHKQQHRILWMDKILQLLAN